MSFKKHVLQKEVIQSSECITFVSGISSLFCEEDHAVKKSREICFRLLRFVGFHQILDKKTAGERFAITLRSDRSRRCPLRPSPKRGSSQGSCRYLREYQIISVPNVCIGKARCPIYVRIVRIQCHFLQATQVRIFIGNIKV